MFKMIIAGNLGKDAEIKEINGQKVLSFSVARTEKYKDQQGNTVDKTTWISCSQWKESSGKFPIAPYLKKGSKVVVSGTPSINAFRDSQNNFRAEFRLRIEEITLMHSTAERNTSNVAPGEVTDTAPAIDAPADDLPF